MDDEHVVQTRESSRPNRNIWGRTVAEAKRAVSGTTNKSKGKLPRSFLSPCFFFSFTTMLHNNAPWAEMMRSPFEEIVNLPTRTTLTTPPLVFVLRFKKKRKKKLFISQRVIKEETKKKKKTAYFRPVNKNKLILLYYFPRIDDIILR